MSEWQPIETAPKNTNRRVLAWDGDGMTIVWFTPFRGWCRPDGALVVGLTHWQPLPEPPLTGSK
jgi:hypothetical protein